MRGWQTGCRSVEGKKIRRRNSNRPCRDRRATNWSAQGKVWPPVRIVFAGTGFALSEVSPCRLDRGLDLWKDRNQPLRPGSDLLWRREKRVVDNVRRRLQACSSRCESTGCKGRVPFAVFPAGGTSLPPKASRWVASRLPAYWRFSRTNPEPGRTCLLHTATSSLPTRRSVSICLRHSTRWRL